MSAREQGWAGAASPLEWVVAAASALLVLGAAGFLLWQGSRAPASPPRITVQVDSVVRASSGWLVEFSARNDGTTTAAKLVVEGELRGGDGEAETSEATLDYVPARGSERGGLYFTRDPRRGRLTLRPLGYERP